MPRSGPGGDERGAPSGRGPDQGVHRQHLRLHARAAIRLATGTMWPRESAPRGRARAGSVASRAVRGRGDRAWRDAAARWPSARPAVAPDRGRGSARVPPGGRVPCRRSAGACRHSGPSWPPAGPMHSRLARCGRPLMHCEDPDVPALPAGARIPPRAARGLRRHGRCLTAQARPFRASHVPATIKAAPPRKPGPGRSAKKVQPTAVDRIRLP